MEELPIETIRETSRNLLVLNRRKNRDEEADTRRSMGNTRILPATVIDISNKLKTKTSITLSELQTLKNALIDDVANIEIVLNTSGALRGLVRELTGHEVNKQCAAAGCCCNLALGDARAGVAVVKAAGPYLVSALDNLTPELAVTCAWTLGNLAGSGPKACELLTAQGAIAKLIDLLNNTNKETNDAAVYALVRFAHLLKDELRLEYLQKIFEYAHNAKIKNSIQLLFILSCHKDFTSDLVTDELLVNFLQHLFACLRSIEEDNLTYTFRFLANANCIEIYQVVLRFIVEHKMVNTVFKLANDNESMLWFLGNASVLCTDHRFWNIMFK